jgi:hypothetical protein
MISDFEPPGCVSLLTLSLKPVGFYDPVEVFRHSPTDFHGIFAGKIKEAMREDGIIS